MRKGKIQGYIKDNKSSFIVLAAVIFLIIIRKPILLIKPRFLAEEGSIFFQYAFLHPWYDTLLKVHNEVGYYTLFDNIATILSSLVPLEYSAFITTYLAFLVQLLPFIVVLFGNSQYWTSISQKIVASLIILFIANTSEIWLTSLHSKFYFCITTFLILTEDLAVSGKYKKIFYTLIIFIAGLTSPLSCFLTPFFILKAWQEEQKPYILQPLILSIISIIQLIIILHFSHTQGGLLTSRLNHFSFIRFFLSIITYNLRLLIFGDNNFINITGELIIFLVILLYLILIYCLASPQKSTHKILFIGGFIEITILITITALNAESDLRYSYVPSVILSLAIMQAAIAYRNNKQRVMSYIGCSLLTCMICFGIYSYFSIYRYYSPNWPVLSEEIKLWRKDNTRKIALHPVDMPTSWYMDLSNY